MPVVSETIRPGGPVIQVDGTHRGGVDVLLDDGRLIYERVDAVDADDWNTQIANVGSLVISKLEKSDGGSNIDPQEPIDPVGEASRPWRCVGYMREAYLQANPYDGYLRYDKVNDYVTSNGGWATVKPLLIANTDMTADEYDTHEAAWNYLSGGTRPADMAAVQPVLDQWNDRSPL